MEVVEDTSTDTQHVVAQTVIPHPHQKTEHEGKRVDVDLVSLTALIRTQLDHVMEPYKEDLEQVGELLEVVNEVRSWGSSKWWSALNWIKRIAFSGTFIVIGINLPL